MLHTRPLNNISSLDKGEGVTSPPAIPVPQNWVRRHVLTRTMSGCAALLLILTAACDNTIDPSLLSDNAVQATATAWNCGCYVHGSYPHPVPSNTPTGTWIAPTPTVTRTPTEPPNCESCTQVPATTLVAAWPSPIVTCTARPDEPTLTSVPTHHPAPFPTLVPLTPLPPLVGNTNPAIISNLEGESGPSSIALDPTTGQPILIWSQIDLDYPDAPTNAVYLYHAPRPPQTQGKTRIVSTSDGTTYRVSHTWPESAVGVTQDGTIYIAYSHSTNAEAVALLTERHSTDHGTTWSNPYTFPYTSAPPGSTLGQITSLRLVIDAQNEPHIAAISKTTNSDSDTSGVIDYYVRQADGSWSATRHPVNGRDGRQFTLDLTTFVVDTHIRTILAWNEDGVLYTSYQDAPAGPWSQPQLIVDGPNYPGIPDFNPGFDHTLRLLPFTAEGHTWCYLFYSIYSTGYMGFNYSENSGQSWSTTDAFAFNPIYHVPPPPAPADPPLVYGTVHNPAPFWDAADQTIFVIYQFCSKDPNHQTCFPAISYSKPGQVGIAWGGYEDPTHEPLRLLESTLAANATTLRVSTVQNGWAWLTWRARLSSTEVYLAIVAPTTLLAGHQP